MIISISSILLVNDSMLTQVQQSTTNADGGEATDKFIKST